VDGVELVNRHAFGHFVVEVAPVDPEIDALLSIPDFPEGKQYTFEVASTDSVIYQDVPFCVLAVVSVDNERHAVLGLEVVQLLVTSCVHLVGNDLAFLEMDVCLS
jgi:hypothetical protein